MTGTRNQGVLKDFPMWLEKVAKEEGVPLQAWQLHIAQAFADGVSVTVYASPGRQAGKQWLYDNLRRYLNEIEEAALTP